MRTPASVFLRPRRHRILGAITQLLTGNKPDLELLHSRGCSTRRDAVDVPLNNILILKKRSRYELEKTQSPGITDERLNQVLKERGTNADSLLRYHELHGAATEEICSEFTSAGFQVRLVDRTQFTEDAIDWADLVASAGGDGTFLIAASSIKSRDKPLVGFNTNPLRSAGYLCIPPHVKYKAAVNAIAKRKFSWKFRTRIEVTLTGTRAHEEPVDLGMSPVTISPGLNEPPDANRVTTKVLPFLALNEVFIGESLSSQVSYLVMEGPGMPETRVKCSGLCVSTGTGSTSWHMSINRMPLYKVQRLLEIAGVKCDNRKIVQIANAFNDTLQFPSDDSRLFYTLRDLICSEVWPDPPGIPSADFIPRLRVSSQCLAANLVLDGSRAWAFNDGAVAELDSRPENMLRTVYLNGVVG